MPLILIDRLWQNLKIGKALSGVTPSHHPWYRNKKSQIPNGLTLLIEEFSCIELNPKQAKQHLWGCQQVQ
jgi:hypothetical protein